MDPTSQSPEQSSATAPQFSQQNAPQNPNPAEIPPSYAQPFPYPADTQFPPPNGQMFPYPMYMTPTQDMTQKINGFSLASMILGILGILSSCTIILGGIFGVLGLIFGIIGLAQQKSGRFTGSSKGFGIAGVITSGVSLLLVLIFVLLLVIGNGNYNFNISGS